jgi:D-glycero-D-manno-heptose 1,7-bisphosphate phosphatase
MRQLGGCHETVVMKQRGDQIRSAVFLDRDGVINEATVRNGRPYPPSNLGDFRLLPGVVEACAHVHDLGMALVVVTNQPDIARGVQDESVIAAMHETLSQQIRPDAIYVCPHDDDGGCACRKPAPGMLLSAAEDLCLDLTRSFMVGDRWRDVEAGRRAGCRTIYVDRGYKERTPPPPDAVVPDLPSAVLWIEAVVAGKKEIRIA